MSEQTKRKVFLLSGGREITVYPREKMPAQKTNKQTSNKKKKSQLLGFWQINPSKPPDKKNMATIQIKYSD